MGKHTQLEAPFLGSCRDGPLQGPAACGPVDVQPRSAAAAAAAVVVNAAAAVAVAVVSADVNGAEVAAAVAAVVPSLGLCERQVYY